MTLPQESSADGSRQRASVERGLTEWRRKALPVVHDRR